MSENHDGKGRDSAGIRAIALSISVYQNESCRLLTNDTKTSTLLLERL